MKQSPFLSKENVEEREGEEIFHWSNEAEMKHVKVNTSELQKYLTAHNFDQIQKSVDLSTITINDVITIHRKLTLEIKFLNAECK
jgi:virulence-associated protein VapD